MRELARLCRGPARSVWGRNAKIHCLSEYSIVHPMLKCVKHLGQLSVKLTSTAVFTKLGSQLSADKLVDLAVIPVIYVIQVGISYLCSILVARAFGFKSKARNFVIAMGVCTNSLVPHPRAAPSNLTALRSLATRTPFPSR